MYRILVLNLPFTIVRRLEFKFNLKVFWVLSLISVLTLLVVYILQVNAIVSEAYLIQQYEKELDKLTQENKNLEINFSQLNSLSNIEGLIKNLSFEKVEKIHYIQILESTVVANKNLKKP